MFIRTERLFLRPAWPEDEQELHAAIADERVVRNLTRAPWPYTREDARAFLARPQDRCVPGFLITLPSARGSRVIGGIGLCEGADGAEMGFWIAPEHWGRGYATEAARAVVRLARTLGHEDVVARHFIDNPAAGAVLEKLGFRPIGSAQQVFSKGRGLTAPAQGYALRLGSASDCDGGIARSACPDEGMQAA